MLISVHSAGKVLDKKFEKVIQKMRYTYDSCYTCMNPESNCVSDRGAIKKKPNYTRRRMKSAAGGLRD